METLIETTAELRRWADAISPFVVGFRRRAVLPAAARERVEFPLRALPEEEAC